MIHMPTGTGKSKLIGLLSDRLRTNQVLIITPRIDLVTQTQPELGNHGVLSGNLGKERGNEHNLFIGTYQTMIKRHDMKVPDVIIIDECHYVPEEGDYRDLIARYPRAAVIGLTATPYRGEKHIKECGLEWQTVFAVSLIDMIKEGILVPPKSMATTDSPSLGMNPSVTAADITTQIIPKLIADVIVQERKKILVFCIDIKHARQTAELLRRHGEKNVYLVHSGPSKSKRKRMYEGFTLDSERSWLINVSLVTFGVNIRPIDCIAILRGVSSYSLLVQMIGRGLRTYGGKKDCLVYDFGNGTSRFGFLDSPLFNDQTKKKETGGFQFKKCPECAANVHLSTMTCQHCGHEFSSSCSLKESSVASQLLSIDYIVVSYVGSQQSTDVKGNHIIEHQLTGSSGDTYRALTAWAQGTPRPRQVSVYAKGTPLLVQRKHQTGSLVNIVAQCAA